MEGPRLALCAIRALYHGMMTLILLCQGVIMKGFVKCTPQKGFSFQKEEEIEIHGWDLLGYLITKEQLINPTVHGIEKLMGFGLIYSQRTDMTVKI